jgi:hypothetical protein
MSRKDTDEGSLRTECCGEYVDPRGMKYWEVGENLHNEELYNLYPPSNNIRNSKSRMMRWKGHVIS